MAKQRLDVLLTELALAPSRERAKAMIMEGAVYVDGQREDKPGAMIGEEKKALIEVRGVKLPYVSRGGLKLEKAVRVWSLSFTDMICADIGASTGGFTDLLLKGGAVKVYAVDSGYGQLHYRLRTDPRVVCMEKTNFRYVTKEQIPDALDFACADVSFISLKKILPAAYPLLKEDAGMVCLVKPQFEAGREKVGKKGVVRDAVVQCEVLQSVCMAAADTGFSCQALDYSPIRGPQGNIEFLLLLKKQRVEQSLETFCSGIEETVRRAHQETERT